MPAALSIFDLVPLPEGSDAEEAIRSSLDLAELADSLGYRRLWYGEHHLNQGVIGYSPAVMIALAGQRTSRLRLGSGAVLAGQRTALSVAEDFALLSAALQGRVDLGLGRAALRRAAPPDKGPDSNGTAQPPAQSTTAAAEDRVTQEGLLLPAAPDLSSLRNSPRVAASADLLLPAGAVIPAYTEFVDDVLSFYRHTAEVRGVALPETTPQLKRPPEIWVLGSSAGESAEVAGRRGLRFGANYHVAPSNVTDAAEHYRANFVPSEELDRPYLIVSAEVLLAETRRQAERQAHGYAAWVHSIRSGRGSIPYPAPESPAAELPAGGQPLVRDRVATRFVGAPTDVVGQLQHLQRATGADELLISTSAHDPQVRARSFALLAEAWE